MTSVAQRISVTAPFRLDLTAELLRLPARRHNDDFITAVSGERGPVVVQVRQLDRTTLEVRLSDSANVDATILQIRTHLGLDDDPAEFYLLAESIPWLAPLARCWPGVRPARTSSLWEAAAVAIVYQSVSMLAAGAVAERFIERFGRRIDRQPFDFTLFPTPQTVAELTTADLFDVGLSTAKVHALKALAAAIQAGEWNADEIEKLSTAVACERFARVRGIGPWSAAVIALRGLGRLNVFPAHDSGVVRTIGALSSSAPHATSDALTMLAETRGMLYHFLLLARLEARGMLPVHTSQLERRFQSDGR